MKTLNWIAIILLIIGGLNWGFVGAFNIDIVAMIFGAMSMLARIIYVIVGVAAIYIAITAPSMSKKM